MYAGDKDVHLWYESTMMIQIYADDTNVMLFKIAAKS